jgi:hypothetical protein
MAKLPGIVQQPVGEFALGNIPLPRYDRLGEAMAGALGAAAQLGAEIYMDKEVAKADEALAGAATELSELRSILENENAVDAAWVGDDALGELQMTVTDGVGGRRELSKPRIFTHEIAADVWGKRSEEIVERYAGQIGNEEARAKFIEEVSTRYIAPGTQAVIGANIVRARAYGQASAERAIEETLASETSDEIKEEQAREIIARQAILGADPKWVEDQRASLGPRLDQFSFQRKIISARTEDELELVREDLYVGDNRLSPEQTRVMDSQIDARVRDFQAADKERQDRNADKMFSAYVLPGQEVTEADVAAAVENDDITWAAGWTLYRDMQEGSTTKASSPWTLSRIRGEIFNLQYTGGQSRVTQKAAILKAIIQKETVGRNGLPATVTGEDAFKLNKDIDDMLGRVLESDTYDRALRDLASWTRVSLNLEGQITTALGGNQNQVEAALAFKRGLDNYMDTHGADAMPADYVERNKDTFNPNNFARGMDSRFAELVPQSQRFMQQPAGEGAELVFVNRAGFEQWLSGQVGIMPDGDIAEILATYKQFYKGEGLAPVGQRWIFEPNDPAYQQFQDMIPDE